MSKGLMSKGLKKKTSKKEESMGISNEHKKNKRIYE